MNLDATTGATPLATMKLIAKGEASVSDLGNSLTDMLIGNTGGCLGEVCAIAILIGLVYMLVKRIITWHIPVSILVTVAIFSGLLYLANPTTYVAPQYELLSGGLLLGAVFMATDYVTSPITPKGQLIYGVAIGFLTMVIRTWGAYPEGMSFAILIMNAFTPLINNYCKPKRFGEVVKK
jgi:electron transport complex protein RnfD